MFALPARQSAGAAVRSLAVAAAYVSALANPATADAAEDKALGRVATASSIRSSGLGPHKAVDGSARTRWSSDYRDRQHWQVDLGRVRKVNRVEIDWTMAHASRYRIQTSTNGSAYSTQADLRMSAARFKATRFRTRNARYVRILAVTRATDRGISFRSVRVRGPIDDNPASAPTPARPILLDEQFDSSASALRPPPSVLLDEQFDGPAGAAPNPDVWWRYDYCDEWGSLSCNLPNNAVLDGSGSLDLTARYVPGHIDRYGNRSTYTAARVESGKRWANTALFSFSHGSASAWIKTPGVQGTWAGFWMLNLKRPDGRYGEFDVMEALGHETAAGTYHATVHTWPGDVAKAGKACTMGVDLASDFHKYTVRWDRGRITYSFDDEPCFAVDSGLLRAWHLDSQPAILLLSLDVGGWAGTPQRTSKFPATMKISRVLVTS